MANRKPLVLDASAVQEIAAGDTLVTSTVPIGDSSNAIATTSFVSTAKGGVTTVNTTGGTTTLTAAQYGNNTIIVTGTLTSTAVVVLPNTGNWIIVNRCTGAFSVTAKTSAGTGIVCASGLTAHLIADGTNVVVAGSDLSSTANPSFTVGSNTQAATAAITLNTAAAQFRGLLYQNAGIMRWAIEVDSTAETGGNAGANIDLARFNDAGAFIDKPWATNRASGQTTITNLLANSLARLTGTGLTTAGTTQATALVLTNLVNVLTTVASGSGASLLNTNPVAGQSVEILVVNQGANPANIFPISNARVDALAINAAYVLAAGATKRFVQTSATQYYSC